jgi:EAL domain-containing protein (putative c-di-GMP-specific phosphodiesterase class I)
MAEISQVMNIETVAKYVEDPALIPLLRQLSIDSVQGFSQGKPTPLDNLKIRQPQRDTTG